MNLKQLQTKIMNNFTTEGVIKYNISFNYNCDYQLEDGVNIFLDDLRIHNKHFHICARNYDTMVELLRFLKENNIKINTISFDHDLGLESENNSGLDGYGVAKYITDFDIPFSFAKFHTDNPTGFKNMQGILLSWQKHVPEAPKVSIDKYSTESLLYLGKTL